MSKAKSSQGKLHPPQNPPEQMGLGLALSKPPTPSTKRRCYTFQGTLIDGPSINLISLAGLKLTDEEHDRLWSQTNPRDLLLDCECVDEIEEEDDSDDMPGKGDRYFRYESPSKKQLAVELKKVILIKLERKS